MKHSIQAFIKSDAEQDAPVEEIKTAPVVSEDTPIQEGGIESDADASVKVGRRNNAKDQQRLQEMHDHTVSMGASCSGMGKSVKAVEGEEASDKAEALGMPLDTLVNAVRDAFWDMRETMRMSQKPFGKEDNEWWDWDDDACPSCTAVYDGFAIARVQLATYKVPYDVQNEGVVLAPQSDWQQVVQDWVAKSLPGETFKAFTLREPGVVKALPGGRLGNYLVLWGDANKPDLTGEWFTKNTKGLTAVFDVMGKVPALYQHGMDAEVKYTPVGVIDTMVADDIGLWTETQLDMANRYAVEMQKLARKKALGASSGTLPGARKVAPTGEILQWAIVEGSFTPTPAEPRLRDLGVSEVKSIYQESGLRLPETLEAQFSTGGEEPRQDDAERDAELEGLRLLELSLID